MPVTANGYCTPNQLVAVLPGLIIGSSADVTSDSIQAEINDVATKIRGSKQRYPLISLNDHQSDLLGMINSPLAEAAIIRRRATDLKPENIILSKEPMIIDFGLATVADEPKYLFVRCGTPGYVAP